MTTADAVRGRPLRLPRWLALVGPAFAVSIGYVDPGNWASDLAAGAYRYSLLWVILLASAIAIVMQLAVTHVTLATGNDLAALIATRWRRWALPLWFAFQGAVIATDLAEFTGVVLGAQLLFHLTLAQSVGFGILVVASVLLIARRRLRLFDAAMLTALGTIACVYVVLVGTMHPDPTAVAAGALIPRVPDMGAVVIIVAIIGATVMPHNLFLHSWLIKQRCTTADGTTTEHRRFFCRETWVALTLAAVVNGAILVVSASLRGRPASIPDAFAALGPLGQPDLVALFGVALIVSGIAASTTATLSGDSIVAAFSPIRLSPFVRRAIAVGPAAALLLAGMDSTALLLWSQTALCLLLPIALVPLAILVRDLDRTADHRRTGLFPLTAAATALCILVDGLLLVQSIT